MNAMPLAPPESPPRTIPPSSSVGRSNSASHRSGSHSSRPLSISSGSVHPPFSSGSGVQRARSSATQPTQRLQELQKQHQHRVLSSQQHRPLHPHPPLRRPGILSASPSRSAAVPAMPMPMSIPPPPPPPPPSAGLPAGPSSGQHPSNVVPPVSTASPPRTGSQRAASGSSSRYHSGSAAASAQPASSSAAPPKYAPMADTSRSATSRAGSHPQPRRRTDIDAPSGHWVLGKTLGAGSMGRVKLAKNSQTGEQAAIKIVPRYSTEEHRSVQERERADQSKDVRTSREAAIVGLVQHPYICGLHDVVRTQHHWYMFFEYVNGGQMLEYIISHGRLKEKQARKFARQIASALDYSHRNSIVHRDLKIENILISKTGDIKIIDFGLSNLFSPTGLLKTFCGSLYFAAPELLQARQYRGPEVDIWSFGVVLYVLVCGKVPFDDQSMPQLHAKIKKGHTEYPAWLTAECRDIISRMLITDPARRITLHEILVHPWITKGYAGITIENFVPVREPLTLPLDPKVIDGMVGFNFGSSESINRELTRVLSSESYRQAVHDYQTKKPPSPVPEVEKKRGVFEFYRRRNSASRDNLAGSTAPGAVAEPIPLGSDPVNAFHPMISIYYLVRERLERQHGQRPRDSDPPLVSPANPLPVQSDGTVSSTGRQSHPAEVSSGQNTRPHDEAEQSNAEPPAPADTPRRSTTASSIFRKFSTRRTRDARIRPSQPAPATAHGVPDSSTSNPPPSTSPFPPKSFSLRRSGTKTGPSSGSLSADDRSPPPQMDLLSPSRIGENFSSRFKALARSKSVNSGGVGRQPNGRRGVSDGTHNDPPHTSGSEASSVEPSAVVRTAQAPSTRAVSSFASPSSPLRSAGATAVPGRARSVGGSHMLHPSRARWKGRPAADESEDQRNRTVSGTREPASPDTLKPVYLKGLFSASTTSSKPLKFIHADIIRVLRVKGVQYAEIRGGFSCSYLVHNGRRAEPNDDHGRPDLLSPITSPGHRRRLSFGGLRHPSRSESKEGSSSYRSPLSPKDTTGHAAGNPSFSASDESDTSGQIGSASRRPHRADGSTAGPSGQTSRTSGIASPRGPSETTTRVQNPSTGQPTLLRFEIFVVKVPLFQLYGIQFKKLAGDLMMEYKDLAQAILNELRL